MTTCTCRLTDTPCAECCVRACALDAWNEAVAAYRAWERATTDEGYYPPAERNAQIRMDRASERWADVAAEVPGLTDAIHWLNIAGPENVAYGN